MSVLNCSSAAAASLRIPRVRIQCRSAIATRGVSPGRTRPSPPQRGGGSGLPGREVVLTACCQI
jgi:hypothetical protein